MKILKIISIIFFSFCLLGFNVKKETIVTKKEVPADFNFTIHDGRNDGYSSEYKSFYRKYLNEERSIKVELTKAELEKIYSFIVKIKFSQMPVAFEPTGKGNIKSTTPSFNMSLVVFANGKKKYVSYDNGATNDANDKNAKPFLDLCNMIWEILYKKQEIKELPESDFRYE
ncbi:hypothetical protein [Pseudomonas shirazensis]